MGRGTALFLLPAWGLALPAPAAADARDGAWLARAWDGDRPVGPQRPARLRRVGGND